MADNFKTIQEQYWAGKSGNDYIALHDTPTL
jgi:hypothetical protein